MFLKKRTISHKMIDRVADKASASTACIEGSNEEIIIISKISCGGRARSGQGMNGSRAASNKIP
jgi:hypothetical protein